MNHHTLSLLKDLIAASNDGEYVFRSGVRRARSAELAMTFACLADNCQQGTRELQECVVRLGGPVLTDRASAALWRCAALGTRRLLAGKDDLALLQSCQRVEERTLLRYHKALAESLPATVQALVERHYRGVQLNHARIRDLLVMHQAIGPLSDDAASNIVALRAVQSRPAGRGRLEGEAPGAKLAAALQKRSMA